MTKQTLLIVEDDAKIRALLRNVFEGEGFCVLEARSSEEVLTALASHQIALITLDIHLGQENGLDLARQIRQTSRVPIIMVSGQDDVIDRVVGLEIGADDYITKPFHVREVVARVRSVLRRFSQDPAAGLQEFDDAALCFDGMCAHVNRMELVDRDGADCGLTSGDFKLLQVFLDRPNRALSRDQLMDFTGGIERNPLDRTIDNQVARLRKKIERDPSDPKLIKTVRGVGYMFAGEVEALRPSDPSSKSA
ncbi:MAG: response regulator transcription factor [Pseudomonadota bacterium]